MPWGGGRVRIIENYVYLGSWLIDQHSNFTVIKGSQNYLEVPSTHHTLAITSWEVKLVPFKGVEKLLDN